MAIPNNFTNMGYCDPEQDRYMQRLRDEQLRNLMMSQQNAWPRGLQQAQQAQPITNPEPNPVLLLLE